MIVGGGVTIAAVPFSYQLPEGYMLMLKADSQTKTQFRDYLYWILDGIFFGEDFDSS